MLTVGRDIHAQQLHRERVHRRAVEDVEEHMLSEMTLGEDPEGASAEQRAVLIADALPRLDKPVGQAADIETAARASSATAWCRS